MIRHKLEAEALQVESFDTAITDSVDSRGGVDQPNGCICFAPPCGCTAGPDCTGA